MRVSMYLCSCHFGNLLSFEQQKVTQQWLLSQPRSWFLKSESNEPVKMIKKIGPNSSKWVVWNSINSIILSIILELLPWFNFFSLVLIWLKSGRFSGHSFQQLCISSMERKHSIMLKELDNIQLKSLRQKYLLFKKFVRFCWL